jgi:hypothetical protein
VQLLLLLSPQVIEMGLLALLTPLVLVGFYFSCALGPDRNTVDLEFESQTP